MALTVLLCRQEASWHVAVKWLLSCKAAGRGLGLSVLLPLLHTALSCHAQVHTSPRRAAAPQNSRQQKERLARGPRYLRATSWSSGPDVTLGFGQPLGVWPGPWGRHPFSAEAKSRKPRAPGHHDRGLEDTDREASAATLLLPDVLSLFHVLFFLAGWTF